MNYRHIYHAGSYADVLKHSIIMLILESLRRKETGFTFLDTHAGVGMYSLDSLEASKTGEYQNGIAKILQRVEMENRTSGHSCAQTTPACIQTYLDAISFYNKDASCRVYPGSPAVARRCLRLQDTMILSELHKEDIMTLKQNFKHDSQVAVHHTDAYLAMKAFLPPKSGRGLVHIDPPFEENDEYIQIEQALSRALSVWRAGCFMIWHPIKEPKLVERFYKKIQKLGAPHLFVRFGLNEILDETRMNECGVVIINPPWMLSEELETRLLPYLAETLDAHWQLDEIG